MAISLSPGGRSLLRPWYRAYQNVKYGLVLPYYRFLDRYQLNDLNSIYDKEYFQKRQQPPYSTIAEEVVDELVDHFNPQSVTDVGCAIGVYLKEFQEQGVAINGIEGSPLAVENAIVENIQQADLRNGVDVSGSSDLVICLEVAEHLHHIYASQLAEMISDAVSEGGIAIVSAAEPGQFGTHHVNLQPKSYWIEIFSDSGLTYDKAETTRLCYSIKERFAEHGINWNATSNLMVFQA